MCFVWLLVIAFSLFWDTFFICITFPELNSSILLLSIGAFMFCYFVNPLWYGVSAIFKTSKIGIPAMELLQSVVLFLAGMSSFVHMEMGV